MNVKRELNIKPSCAREIFGFPSSQSAQLWEKINYLVDDPLPDGKLKKKLKGRDDVYRLRVGDHRVFYSFGDNWIRLLGIRKRDERTYGDRSTDLDYEEPAVVPPDPEVDLDELEPPSLESRPAFHFNPAHVPQRLPVQLSAEFLQALRIPPIYFSALLPCTTEEGLLAAPVPEEILQLVVDNLFPRPIEEILQQPDLVVLDTKDLLRLKEGTLVSFLLKLDPEQAQLVRWALKGPTLVKGGAGTGKSTVALYRVKALLEQPKATGRETVLFTTYTRALQSASLQLLGQLLTPEQLKRVRVATCDQVARDLVASKRRLGSLEPPGTLAETLHEVRAKFEPLAETGFERKLRARALAKLPDAYLLDEFAWIIEGQGLTSLEAYLEASRPGRRLPFGAKLRTVVWELHQAFLKTLSERKVETWSGVRNEALHLVTTGACSNRYDFVMVDEAQDLTPIAVRLMAELAQRPEGIFFASDSKQSIYSKGQAWTSAHPRLDFRGRTALLQQNYRSTAEIDRAAFGVLRPADEEPLVASTSLYSGPLPVLVRGSNQDEADWVARFIRQMSSFLRLKLNAAAVLVPSQKIGELIAKQLTIGGLAAKFYPGKDLNLRAPEVKVLTLHSAKGLEFPTVVICGLQPGSYPVAEQFEDSAEFEEELAWHRRLLYVGMTRAMRGLMVIQPAGCADPAFQGINAEHWNIQEVA